MHPRFLSILPFDPRLLSGLSIDSSIAVFRAPGDGVSEWLLSESDALLCRLGECLSLSGYSVDERGVALGTWIRNIQYNASYIAACLSSKLHTKIYVSCVVFLTLADASRSETPPGYTIFNP